MISRTSHRNGSFPVTDNLNAANSLGISNTRLAAFAVPDVRIGKATGFLDEDRQEFDKAAQWLENAVSIGYSSLFRYLLSRNR